VLPRVDPALPAYQPARALSGQVAARGYEPMEGVMKEWAALVRAADPGLAFHVETGSSESSARALVEGRVEVAFIGRPFSEMEVSAFTKAWGYAPVRIDVTGGTHNDIRTYAEIVYVHPDNPLRGLTLAQFDAIFSEERKRGASKPIDTWGEVGLGGEWADKPVHAIVPNGGPNSLSSLAETMLKGGHWRKSARVLTDRNAPVAARTVTSGHSVVPEILKDRYAIGITGLAYAAGTTLRLVPIAVEEGGPFIEPTLENVAGRKYPFYRPIHFYVNKAPGKPLDPLVRELVRAVLSTEGQAAALRDDWIPLSAELARAELSKIE
jgi:phosphate transport system substrate-binding protein